MWSNKRTIILTILIHLVHCYNFTSSTTVSGSSVRGCTEEPSCLKCGSNGCIKCPTLIVHQTRQCVNQCPFGHHPRWSTYVDYMGRICISNGNFLGLESSIAAILTGILTGSVLSLFIIISAVIYLRYKRKNSPPNSIETCSDMDDSPERKDFLKQLETLRPYAQNYLDMLNDTRRQLRELHREGDNSAIAAYKPVVRDLAKILLLLNRQIDRIAMPDDWEHLFNWAEKALKRYKRMSDVSQPQVAQLINFLQGPILPTHEMELRGSTTMSTFKPSDHDHDHHHNNHFGSAISLQNIAVKNFDNNYEAATLNPQWKFEYSLVNTTSSEFNPQLWKNSKEYLNNSLFLDDDFCQLGFRPQDEITTEL